MTDPFDILTLQDDFIKQSSENNEETILGYYNSTESYDRLQKLIKDPSISSGPNSGNINDSGFGAVRTMFPPHPLSSPQYEDPLKYDFRTLEYLINNKIRHAYAGGYIMMGYPELTNFKSSFRQHKIHIMPKKEYITLILHVIYNLYKKDEIKISDMKVLFQFDTKKPFNPSAAQVLNSNQTVPVEQITPTIVLYCAQSDLTSYPSTKLACENNIKKLHNIFTDDIARIFGSGITPRLNKKVNDLIFYAAGHYDVKKKYLDSPEKKQVYTDDLTEYKEEQHQLNLTGGNIYAHKYKKYKQKYLTLSAKYKK